MEKKHVVVIGAGPGGLTAAMILAHRGFRVTVLEAKDVVGGRNAPLRIGHYTFETGPTFLMMSFILKEMFQEAGRRAEDYLTFKRLEPSYNLKFDSLDVTGSSDPAAMQAEIKRRFPGEENGMSAFMAYEGRRYERMFPCLQFDYSHISRLFSKPLLKALPYLGLGKSVWQNLGRYFKDDRLKLSFTFQSKYLGMSAWDCPALFTMVTYIEYLYGVYHVIGGLNRISEAMAKVVREEGGEIRLNARAASFITEGKALKGVALESGEKVMADDVIVGADFAHAMSTLAPPGLLKKYSRENLAKRDYSCSTFMIYLALDTRYDTAHHTIVFARDYHTNVNNIFHAKVLSDDMSFYVQNASVTDPTLAPAGHSALYVLVPVPNLSGSINWEKEKEPYRRKVLDAVRERLGLVDLTRHIVAEKVVTPVDWWNDHDVYLGATFNLSHKLSQLLYFRPHNEFEELRNCYLVGGGTHPGSGLPTIYESARISSNLISKKYGVPYRTPAGLATKETIPAAP